MSENAANERSALAARARTNAADARAIIKAGQIIQPTVELVEFFEAVARVLSAEPSSDETKEDPVLEISDFPEHIELHPDFGDPEVMLNAREWLQKACEAKGARFTGGGIGMGESDIDIELEGCHFNIRMKPIMRSAHTVKGDETKGRLFYHPECASCKAGHLPCIHGYHASCPHGCVTWREDEERNRASENGLGDP